MIINNNERDSSEVITICNAYKYDNRSGVYTNQITKHIDSVTEFFRDSYIMECEATKYKLILRRPGSTIGQIEINDKRVVTRIIIKDNHIKSAIEAHNLNKFIGVTIPDFITIKATNNNEER